MSSNADRIAARPVRLRICIQVADQAAERVGRNGHDVVAGDHAVVFEPISMADPQFGG